MLLLATGFMSDSASLPFVFSNLTNIISADFFGILFWGYFSSMWAMFLRLVGR
ncbi:ArsB/NhaD family transporter [Campylobacter sp.]|uniref:ArsB/NhaD family transporter n=1 Tax=Campylobacter sp. TaxID=205 RepID=UPI002A80C738|nr:ArsB/NhaD family transporter [Campylobacter sp.]MDY4803573.1 ArsB/NhaD family transporter [Campylobacter sp.]MDY5466710.1 ArsB/NhaD family transporter [Campylobacter sp.]